MIVFKNILKEPMRFLLILTLVLGFSYYSQGQFLHTPSEIEQILSKNPKKWVFQEEKTIKSEEFSSCRRKQESKNYDKSLKWTSETYVFKTYSSKTTKKKIKTLLKDLKANKVKDEAATYAELAKLNFQDQNYEQAIYFKKLEQEHRNDQMMGKLLLAKCYHMLGKHELAMDQIIEAKIMNAFCVTAQKYPRSYNKSFDKLMAEILAKNQLQYDDWQLDPLYCMEVNGDSARINYQSEIWKAYAQCKAVWAHEKGYKEKMKSISNQSQLIVEEKESLLNALTAYLRLADKKGFEAFQYVGQALDNGFIDQLIIYELYLSKNRPYPYFNLENNDMASIKNYFKLAHCIPLSN